MTTRDARPHGPPGLAADRCPGRHRVAGRWRAIGLGAALAAVVLSGAGPVRALERESAAMSPGSAPPPTHALPSLGVTPGDEPALRGDWQVWLNPGLYSRHFDRDLGLRENNWGLGVEVMASRELGVVAGGYHNSNDRFSRYAGVLWRPLWWGDPNRWQAGLGVIVAAFDGYPRMRDGGWFLGAVPVLAIEYRRVGIHLTVVPDYRDQLSGAVAVQLRWRAW